MPREVSSELEGLLSLDGVYTQSTLSIYPVTGDPVHIATDKFTHNGKDYKSDLGRIDEIRQSVGVSTDRLTGEAQNVTKTMGLAVVDESLVKAVGVVGRYYYDVRGILPATWVELFRGEFIGLEINEGVVKLEVLQDLVAAGFCVAAWTLAENCQFVYKHAGTCGFAGSEPSCNKRRKSLGGCAGKIVTGTTTNEFRFGGMEFPEVQAPAPPSGSGSGGGIGGGGEGDPGFPPWTCPTLDQWVLARGRGLRPVPVQVKDLDQDDELFNPIWKTFHEIDALRVVPEQPIWGIRTENGGLGLSSFTHPVLWYREHANGSPAERFMQGDPVLTWAGEYLDDTKCSHSEDVGMQEDVMAITLVDGRIYCYSDTPEGPWIVCHNKQQYEGGYVN